MTEIPTLSNPRREVTIEDWPFGRHTCKCEFTVEANEKHGERVARRTENKTRTGWNKPKRTTYASKFVIVDGDDGKTYLLSFNRMWQSIVLHSGDMKYTLLTIRADDDDEERWVNWLDLIGGA